MTEPAAPPAPPPATPLIEPRTGNVVEADSVNVETLLRSGYALATPDQVAAERERQQYGEGLGNELAAGAEGLLSGATVGLSDVAAKAIAPEYAAELAKRREYNPTSAMIGEGAGILGSALLTGGATAEGALARGALGAAKVATAPARALIGAGEAVAGAGLKAFGAEAATGVLGQALRTGAAYGLSGAVEGGLFGAAKVATDDFLNDHEITAERVIAGAEHGALAGGLLGGAIGAGGVLAARSAEKVWPALKKAIDVDSLDVDDFVGERAYKAALGGRNLRDVQRSERIGGPSDVGQTLLREGIVTPTSTTETIASAAKARSSELGKQIDDLYTQLDNLGTAPSASKAWQKIEDDVIAPLKASPVKRDIGEAIESKLSYLKESLSKQDVPVIVRSADGAERALDRDAATFRQLWELTKDLGERARYDQVPGAVNPVADGLKQARNALRDYIQETGDAAAKANGTVGDLIGELRGANKTFSQVKHAQEIAEKAIARDSANRMLSPSDYGFGAVMAGADVLTGGGASLSTLAYGLASGAVHKFFRERGSAMFAGTVHAMRGAPKLVRDARAGEELVESAGSGFVTRLMASADRAASSTKNATIAASARSVASPAAYEQAAQKAASLSNPDSPERQEMKRHSAAVRVEYPALADAMDAKTQAIADFIAEKAGPLSVTPKAGDPFGHLRKPRHSAEKAAKLARYIDAATNPSHALERISKGDITREDVEVLQKLYPRLYQRVVSNVLSRIGEVEKLPSYEKRLALSHLLNAPADPSMVPERAAALQELARSGAQPAAQSAADSVGEPVLAPSDRRAPTKLSGMYSTQADRYAAPNN